MIIRVIETTLIAGVILFGAYLSLLRLIERAGRHKSERWYNAQICWHPETQRYEIRFPDFQMTLWIDADEILERGGLLGVRTIAEAHRCPHQWVSAAEYSGAVA